MHTSRQARSRPGRLKRAVAIGGTVLLCSFVLVGCFEISNSALPDAAQGVSYTTTIVAVGGHEPYTWVLTAGALPPGLSLDGSTGKITGTAPTLGTSNFDVKVTGSDAKSQTKSLSIRVVVPGTWSQVDNDEGRRGWDSAETSLTAANVAGIHEEWKVPTGTSPAVVTGHTAYVNGLLPSSNDPALMAYDVSSGDLAWSVPLATSCGAGVVALTGTAVISECGNAVEAYRLAAPHDLLWTTADTDPGNTASDLLVSNSTVVTWNSGAVTGYDATTGERQWQQLADGVSSVAVGGGRAVVTSTGRVAAFNLADGSQAWAQFVNVYGRVTVADGWAYVTVDGLITRYLVADGSHGWTSKADPGGLSAEGVWAVDGTTVYSYWTAYDFGSDTLVLRALRWTTGGERWRQTLPTRLKSLAVVGDLLWATTSDAGIYGGQAGQLDAYSRVDGTDLATVPFDSRVSPGTAFSDGHAFVLANGLRSIGLAPPAPTITNQALRSGRVGAAYSDQLAATGGTPPFHWSVSSGSLPGGVLLSTAGALSGSPTATASAPVTFRVTDAASRTRNRALVLQVAAAGGTSAWSTSGSDASRNSLNVAETGVGLDHAVQMANRWKTIAAPGTSVANAEPISTGGRLYATGRDGLLRAWTATGTGTNRVAVWTGSADPGEFFVSGPSESAGTIYVVGTDAAVYAFRASDGVRLWRQVTEPGLSGYSSEIGAPLISGGKVIIARPNPSGQGLDLWAMSATDGTPAWGGTPRNAPGIQGGFNEPATPISDGTRVYVAMNCELTAFNLADGAAVWDRIIDVDGRADCNPYFGTLGAPAVAGGVVYAGSFNTTAAFDAATGNVRWRVREGTSGGVTVSNGVVVVSLITNVNEFGWSLQPGGLDASTGSLLWSATGYGSTSSPSVAGDLVLFGSNNNVFGFDIRTGTRVWDSGTVSTPDTVVTRPAIAANRIFVPAGDGTIRALGPP